MKHANETCNHARFCATHSYCFEPAQQKMNAKYSFKNFHSFKYLISEVENEVVIDHNNC